MIATARILMPKAMVRLSAGREQMSDEEQALCFLAGANSIFAGDKLLTTPNPGNDRDREMFSLLGLRPRPAYRAEQELRESEAEQVHQNGSRPVLSDSVSSDSVSFDTAPSLSNS